MSNKRITDLTELTTPTTDDVFPVVDIATNTTTKVQLGNLPVPTSVTTALATKQDTLVSGTNIKTINSTSLLGSGNITIAANPSGVAGAIQFSDGSAFASDASNLFWDDTNNRLGVGTAAPTRTLEVRGSALIQNVSTTDGSMQVGTNLGGIILTAANRSEISMANNARMTTRGTGITFRSTVGEPNGAILGVIGSGSTSATNSLLVQNSAGTETFRVRDDGRVLIPLPAGQVCLVDNLGGYNTDTIGIGGRLNINGLYSAINASAVLQANSTTQGFLPPRMTTTQRDAIATPATGLKVYNTTTNTTDTYDGTTWQRFGQQTLIKGSGSTSATTSLLVQNSAGSTALTLKDDLSGIFTGIIDFQNNVSFRGANFTQSNLNMRFVVPGATKTFLINADYADTNAPSAILEVQSTTKGLLPPRMTTTQKNAIATPASGLVVYDSTTNKLCCYNGSTWNDLF